MNKNFKQILSVILCVVMLCGAVPMGITSFAAGRTVVTNETYTITYNCNGGTNQPETQSGQTMYFVTATIPVRNGYDFLGWSEDQNATSATYKANQTITISKNTVLYAVWVQSSSNYYISYDANGGSGAPETQTGSETYVIPSKTPSRQGFTFLGWSEEKNAAAATYKPNDTVKPTKNLLLYAVWFNPNVRYTVTYNANGGFGGPTSQTNQESYVIPTSEPVRTGFRFIGWSTDPGATYASYTAGSMITPTTDITLYAVWEVVPVYYKLTYDANGGAGAPPAQSNNNKYTVSSVIPTRSGYNFLGWALESDSLFATYIAGYVINLTADTTLYAVWSPITSVVITYVNEGTTTSQAVSYGSVVTPPVPTKTNSSITSFGTKYIFEGWSKSETGSTIDYPSGTTFLANEDMTLYAVWKTEVSPIVRFFQIIFSPITWLVQIIVSLLGTWTPIVTA